MAENAEVVTILPDLRIEKQLFDSNSKIDLFDYRDVVVDHRDGLMYRNLSFVHKEQLTVGRIKKRFPNPIWQISQRPNSKVYLHLMGKNSGSYGHFIFEQLPRLLRYHSILQRPLDDFGILVKPDCVSWLVDLLDNLNLGNPTIVPVEKTMSYADLFYVDPPDNRAQVFDSFDRKLLIKSLKRVVETKKGDRIVFVSRKRAAKRALKNEDELVEITRATFPDLEIVDCSQISLGKEIELAQECSLAIGAAGQNFSLGPFFGSSTSALILAKRDVRPFNWASRYALMASLSGGLGSVCFPTYDWPSFHDHWAYDGACFENQLRVFLTLRDEMRHA